MLTGVKPLENKVLAAFHLSKEFTAAYNNYLTIRFSLQRGTKRRPSVYTKADMLEKKAVVLATWKPLKRAMRFAIEYKQL